MTAELNYDILNEVTDLIREIKREVDRIKQERDSAITVIETVMVCTEDTDTLHKLAKNYLQSVKKDLSRGN